MPASTSLEEIVTEVRSIALSHPLYAEFHGLNLAQLRVFGEQFDLFARNFPGYIGALIWTIPDKRMRAMLALNLIDELGDWEKVKAGDLSGMHTELFRQFTRAIGIPDEALDDVQPLPTTQAFLDTYERLTLHSHPLEALGAFGPGNECIADKWQQIYEGLKALGRFDEKDLEFFSVHCAVDEEHGQMIYGYLASYMDDPTNREIVRKGALAAVNARKTFYDGLAQAFSKPYCSGRDSLSQ